MSLHGDALMCRIQEMGMDVEGRLRHHYLSGNNKSDMKIYN